MSTSPAPCCSRSSWRDLSQGIGERRNWYCPNCKAHFYDGRLWSTDEWSRWIESAADDQPATCRRCSNAEALIDGRDAGTGVGS